MILNGSLALILGISDVDVAGGDELGAAFNLIAFLMAI